MNKRTIIHSLCGLVLCAIGAMDMARASATLLPPAGAEEVVAAGGGWLVREARAVRLIDAHGKEQAVLRVRGEHLDARSTKDGLFAVVMNADTQQVQMLDVLPASGRWTIRDPLSITTVMVETLCLYRDGRNVDHLVVIGKDGLSEEWLLGDRPVLFRRLALPAGAEHCAVDDATGTLFVGEAGVGIWAYDIASERAPQRRPVLLRKPWGTLEGDAGPLVTLPGGLAVADDAAGIIRVLRETSDGWGAEASIRTSGPVDALLAHPVGESIDILAASGSATPWQRYSRPWKAPSTTAAAMATVTPRAQTDPVARLGDAADDPAIWVHPTQPRLSRVLGTDKKQGLLVFNLAGSLLRTLDVGRLNNVDLRQRVRFGKAQYDLAVATHRDDHSLVVFGIDAEGLVQELHRIPTGLRDIYGVCLYAPPGGGLQVVANDKDGSVRQFAVTRRNGRWGGTLLRQFELESQPEGCVVDDVRGRLFIGEEKRGVWALAADGKAPARPVLILPVGDILRADVEGMAIHHGAKPYLVVSSQGNNSYVVLDAMAPYAVRGTFGIALDHQRVIDGTSETDGLDVTAAALGEDYTQGLLVVQDGFKRLPDGPQNFKYVAWADVVKALGLP
ncbi:phytase [Tahibacter amnicola]|uniref:Phytase n=1 Tax=Tahibacter amnicola TaxID=2976241 RepID=A0ABY6BIM2_9GAMM|nr:phytase [Tahibacter amnicola]UXI69690.1 phytase [Tahibacter amnicola]